MKHPTIPQLISKIYTAQKVNSKKRGHLPPNYTLEQFSNWMYWQGVEWIYQTWELSGFEKGLIPSVDRLNPEVGYCIGNIELVTWNENRARNVSHMSRAIKCTHKGVETIYPSITAAAEQLGLGRTTIKKSIEDTTGNGWWYEPYFEYI